METNVVGNKAKRKQALIRKVVRGEIVECCCGMLRAAAKKVENDVG
jgi:hypothetical protein